MKRFVVPPSWPTPPRRSWLPPKTWRPDPSWPAAPDDWKFWVDGKGNAVRGPVGRYGGPSRRVVALGAGGLVLFLAVNFWALSAIGLFNGGPSNSQAVPVVDDRLPTPTPTPTPSVQPTTPPRTTATTPTPPPVAKTTKPTRTPSPTKSKTTQQREEREERETTPTKPPVAKATKKPTRPTPSRPPTREEMIVQYCLAQGWDAAFCDPDNWPDSDGP